jgi:hypothetical protein
MKHYNVYRFALAALLVGGYPAGLAAQDESDNTPYGTTSAEFLLLGAGARGAALGGAYSAIANDVSALYYNPAGAALMTQPGISLSTYTYVADTRYSWGGVAFPVSGGARAFGIHLGTFGFKDQPVYTAEEPEGTGSVYSVSETYVGATYAENFSDRFSAGLTAKFIFDKLGDAEGNAFAVDFGTNFHSALNNHPIKFSFVIVNLGTNISYGGDALNADVPREPLPGEDPVPTLPQPATLRTKEFPLPTVFRVGLAYDLLAGEDTRLTLLGDFNQANNNKAGFVFGSELALNRLGGSGFGAAVRGSYSYTAANNLSPISSSDTQLSSEEDLQGLAFGGGLGYQTEGFSIGFDYAWRYLGVLGSTNYFTFNIGW